MTWTPFKGFVGPSYPLKAKSIDTQRLINMYPEMIESGTGREGQIAYLKSIPGYEEIMNIGSGPIRLVHIDNPKVSLSNPTNRMFVVSGAEVWMCEWTGVNSWTQTKLGDLETSAGPVRAESAQINLGVTIFVDGLNAYLYWKYVDDGLTHEDFDKFSEFGYFAPDNPVKVIWIDGYFIFISKDSGIFYVTDWNSINVDPLSFASSEGDPDNIVSIIANHRDLIILNERSTEVFVNTGNADFPFERVQGGFIEKGCLAIDSVAKIDGKVAWLARDEFGQGMIYAIQGLSPQRISTHALEAKIATYTKLNEASAYTYQIDGHYFYVINFVEATWCYDFTTGQWHEEVSLENGLLKRNRLNYLKFSPYLNEHIAADFETNQIFQLNDSVYKCDGRPLVRERISPHVSASGLLMICHALKIEMEVGVGLNGIDQGSNPKAMLSWSDDGGYTWSNERTASIGKIGERKARVIFRRLGAYRDRVYKLRFTDPVPITILSADVDIEVGAA